MESDVTPTLCVAHGSHTVSSSEHYYKPVSVVRIRFTVERLRLQKCECERQCAEPLHKQQYPSRASHGHNTRAAC